MKQSNSALSATLCAIAMAFACGKKDEKSSSAPEQAKDLNEAFSILNTSVGTLNLATYSIAALRADSSGPSLALADDVWDAASWGTTQRFNWFGDGHPGTSATAREYLHDALDKNLPGPMGAVAKGFGPFCYLGVLMPASGFDSVTGLPVVGLYPVTMTDAMKEALKTTCNMTDRDIQGIPSDGLSITVAESASASFDRRITFEIKGDSEEMSYPFEFKNSAGIVAISSMEKTGTAASGRVSRMIVQQDMSTKIFRMEYYDRTFPVPARGSAIGGGDVDSYSFYRGFYDGNTKEVRFFSNMGNSNFYANSTFLGLNGNEGESQAGAYFHRTADGEGTELAGAFVCFNRTDGAFINTTGCTENSANDRKQVWTSESPLWVTVTGKGFADWGPTVGAIPQFDATTMFTVEPNYK